MTEPAVDVRGLVKNYADLRAVDGIDLHIDRGEIFALLGPNGAGKTTTVEILEGYRNRDAGAVQVLGFDPARERSELNKHIGIVLQSTGVEPYLTVAETVTMYAGFYPHPRPVQEVIDLVDLAAKAGERVVRLSGGQQRRLDMAVALVGDPELLFLDEPTTGFDPSARHEAWNVVKSLAALGKTVLLTTHFMDEAQYLADRVAVMSGGHIVAEGSPASLRSDAATVTRIRFRVAAPAAVPASFSAHAGPDGFLDISTEQPVSVLHELTGWALNAGVDLEGLEVSPPSLEDVYLQLTDGAA